VGRDDLVLDLGAGSGRLTAELVRVARRVVAVELDPGWASRLRDRWANVEVLEGDAARVPLPREPFRVVANLPFDATTAILRHLLDDPSVPLVRADLIVEWRVAVKRALPWPSTVNDVLWGAWYATSLARRIPRRCFDPPPSVDAGVLVVERRPQSLVPESHYESYRRFVAAGFRRPRSAGVRSPRDLDAHQWAALFSRSRSSARGASS
jgi:16S rRNA A1518/A1519 N6-dimethyltransferase RsmA/KsgA/DIM1 with predicted DNA glycosylase/AP lyase activity